jgi:hypothetical protein
MFAEVSGPARDLHSGVFGRTVHEPMTDLIAILGKLVAPDGKILVPGVDDMINAADNEERCEVVKQWFNSRRLKPCAEQFTIASITPSLTLKLPSGHPSLYQMTRPKCSWVG